MGSIRSLFAQKFTKILKRKANFNLSFFVRRKRETILNVLMILTIQKVKQSKHMRCLKTITKNLFSKNKYCIEMAIQWHHRSPGIGKLFQTTPNFRASILGRERGLLFFQPQSGSKIAKQIWFLYPF